MASTSETADENPRRANQRFYTLNEVIDQIDNEDEWDSASIYMLPPDSQENETDEDSADEDAVPSIDNLTARQLKASCSATVRTRSGEQRVIGDESDTESASSSDEEVDVPTNRKQSKTENRQWKKTDLHTETPTFTSENWMKDTDMTPTSLFELFFDPEVIDHILNMSKLYAQQSNKNSFSLSESDLKLTLAILIISGYSPLPRRRMYWENSEDSFNSAVSSSLSVNRFEEILRYLHFADNYNLDPNDKMAKMRPLFSMLNERFLNYWVPEQDINVDESMAPYYGRHGAKQYIRGKPIRFGYKMWCLNTPTGYLIQTEPYQGKGTVKIRPNLGMCGSVVMDLLSELPQLSYNVYFDNLFTSLGLLEELKNKNMTGTGTLRQNRTDKCPILSVNQMKKMPRGTEDHRLDTRNNILVVRWNDNSVVSVASNVFGVTPQKKVQRYSQAAKQQIQVSMPNALAQYNSSMGGTDRMDQNIANYRVNIRIKKWWWPLFVFGLMTSTHNAWILYRKSAAATLKPLDYLGFLRQIALSYVFKHRNTSRGNPTAGRVERLLGDGIRNEGGVHFLMSWPTQRRCRLCHGNTKKACTRCPSCPLHERCFEQYHRK